MSAATTIAPALNPIRTAPSRRIDAPVVVDRPVEPQHMQALARANQVRLARAELKRQIAAGRRSAVEVVLTCPWEAESMSVNELLCSQRRWGRARSRKLIVSVELTETKRLGTLTERQRKILARALEAKETCA
jgi:hypothetical protein